MINRLFAACLACGLALLALVAPAAAHPHVWVEVRSELDYAPDGTLKGVRHNWTFDEAFSSFALQGLPTKADGSPSDETLKDLAKVNIDSLKEFDYFTYAKRGKTDVAFLPPADDYTLTYDGKSLTLHFTLPFATPQPKKGALTLDVYDPTYFVAFQLADEAPITLAGNAQDCALTLHRPDPAVGQTTTLSESFFSALTATSEFGSQFANRVTVTCS